MTLDAQVLTRNNNQFSAQVTQNASTDFVSETTP